MAEEESVLHSLAAQSKDTYRHLLEAMPVMLWTADAGGQWTHVNGAWVAYTGISSEARGFGFEQALHPHDEARTVAVWTRAVARGENYEIEYRLRGRDRAYRWFLIRGVRVAGDHGADVAWVGTCTDIEAQKRAELEASAAREAAVRALGLALEARDRETKGHIDRVTAAAVRLGEALGLGAGQLEALRLGAYLHDLGKLSVADAILLKPGPLDEAEWAVMRGHVREGQRLAAALGFLPPETLDVIGAHHERWNGSGYPAGLRGEQIPLLARIFTVVDVHDALSHERPYKAAWPPAQVAATLRAEAGQQFDRRIVEVFLALPAGAEELPG